MFYPGNKSRSHHGTLVEDLELADGIHLTNDITVSVASRHGENSSPQEPAKCYGAVSVDTIGGP